MTTNMTRADALMDESARIIAHRIYCNLGYCGSDPRCFNGADSVTQQRWIRAVKDAAPLFPAATVELPGPITAQTALAAIETFEIVGESNDSREPNDDDRFLLHEFIAHAFGSFPVTQPSKDASRAWEYSFIHSSGLDRGDTKIGPCLTYERSIAFGVGCIEQREVFVSATGVSAQPELPAADERAAIDAVDAVLKANAVFFGREKLRQTVNAARASSPNAAGAEGRPAWADEIIDSLQGSFDTEGITENDSGDALIRLSSAIAAVEDVAESRAPCTDVAGACKRCGATTAQACNDKGCFYLESGDGEPSADAAAAPADVREEIPKWIFDDMVATLTPAWDYIQTHQEQFNAKAGDDKTRILVDEFLRHVTKAVAPADAQAVEAVAWIERARAALEPFANVGQWLFARALPDETPVVNVMGLNGQAGALTRGMFKAAHAALHAAPPPPAPASDTAGFPTLCGACGNYVAIEADHEEWCGYLGWKKRALDAEALNRKFMGSVNGPTHMGEPVVAPASAPVGMADRQREKLDRHLEDIAGLIKFDGGPTKRDLQTILHVVREARALLKGDKQ